MNKIFSRMPPFLLYVNNFMFSTLYELDNIKDEVLPYLCNITEATYEVKVFVEFFYKLYTANLMTYFDYFNFKETLIKSKKCSQGRKTGLRNL